MAEGAAAFTLERQQQQRAAALACSGRPSSRRQMQLFPSSLLSFIQEPLSWARRVLVPRLTCDAPHPPCIAFCDGAVINQKQTVMLMLIAALWQWGRRDTAIRWLDSGEV